MKKLSKTFTLSLCTLLCGVMGILTSCEDHTEETDNSLRVGNIYLSDNRVVSPAGYDPKHDDAVGVIYYVGHDTALVVSKWEMGSYIYSDSLGAISDVDGEAMTLCGQTNTAAIQASEFKNHFPALIALSSYPSSVKGWVLPSAGDLQAISANLGVVASSMDLIGGEPFGREMYFSCSQDGTSAATEQEYYYTVSLYNGYVTSTHKSAASTLRLILPVK